MKNNFKYYVIYWMILVIMFNVIIFVVFNNVRENNEFDKMFWMVYFWIILTFVGQLACSYIGFQSKTNEMFFLNFPMFAISYLALIFSAIIGLSSIVIADLPDWIGIILCTLVLGFYAIAVVKTRMAVKLVLESQHKIKCQSFFVRSFIVDLENLRGKMDNYDVKIACKKIYEAMLYSDPISQESLKVIESQIMCKFDEFVDAIKKKNTNILDLADDLVILIDERNRKCKLLK